MIKLLQFLWHGCWHDWQYIRDINQMIWSPEEMRSVIGCVDRVYVCKKCGRTKSHSY